MKKVLVLLTLLAAVCGLLTFSAAAESAAASGICGENLTWTLDAAGTLTVSGTGAMKDYNYKGAPWYQSRDSIKAVVVESGVTTIGKYAFSACSSLSSITIPEGVTTIGEYAFSGCSSLISITIPESVTTIGDSAFDYCSSLTDVFITDLAAWCRIDFADYSATPMYYISIIGESARNIYLNGEKIVSVAVPEGITEVKAYTFYGFKDLIQVTIPEGVTTIGKDAFGDCSSLTRVTFAGKSQLTTIGDSAFYCCYSLTDITIPESVTNINERAFYCCESLTDVYITDLEAWCRISFTDSQAIPTLYAENIYLNGEKIVSVTVPAGITEVKAYTFCGFKDLSEVTLPKSLTTIGEDAFNECSNLTSINIPESVTAIGNSAFDDCSRLTSTISRRALPLSVPGRSASAAA